MSVCACAMHVCIHVHVQHERVCVSYMYMCIASLWMIGHSVAHVAKHSLIGQ